MSSSMHRLVLPFSSRLIEAGFPLLLGGRKARLTLLAWVGLLNHARVVAR
jgi:hypothetical protein